ncbi:hypothetical protein QBC34DRAFT_441071 [Podospora aff. communis PSN243]|uniref:Uncharacterized protein n=1 Tax=Podospora aff. communis PSN243 TaxID=3040156 RepID=A0AAV9GDA7_9PEZI|nr:hypothetical protein QBC34DRAFT_441071 [Podospora aff. communis PSN243]
MHSEPMTQGVKQYEGQARVIPLGTTLLDRLQTLSAILKDSELLHDRSIDQYRRWIEGKKAKRRAVTEAIAHDVEQRQRETNILNSVLSSRKEELWKSQEELRREVDAFDNEMALYAGSCLRTKTSLERKVNEALAGDHASIVLPSCMYGTLRTYEVESEPEPGVAVVHDELEPGVTAGAGARVNPIELSGSNDEAGKRKLTACDGPPLKRAKDNEQAHRLVNADNAWPTVVNFYDIYQDGQLDPLNMYKIVEFPTKSMQGKDQQCGDIPQGWYILRCLEHGLRFGDEDKDVLKAALGHMRQTVSHEGRSENYEGAVREFGVVVLNCDAEGMGRNNALIADAVKKEIEKKTAPEASMTARLSLRLVNKPMALLEQPVTLATQHG